MSEGFRKKWPIVIALSLLGILAACLPDARAAAGRTGYFVECSTCRSGRGWHATPALRLNRMLLQRRLLLIARGLFLILRAAGIAIRQAMRRCRAMMGTYTFKT